MRMKVVILSAAVSLVMGLPVNASDSGRWVGWTSSPQDLGNVSLDIQVAMAAPRGPNTGEVTPAPAPSSPEIEVAVVPLDTLPARSKPVVRRVRLETAQVVATAPVAGMLHPERLWTIGSFR
jgi:hypothetical protein